MSQDLERQLAAFARALDARSEQAGEFTASQEVPRHRAGLGALIAASVAVVLLVVLPVVFFTSDPVAVPPSTTAPPSTSTPTTAPGEPLAIPDTGVAILSSDGIRSAGGTMIWSQGANGRGRLFRDGDGNLVFADSHGVWWVTSSGSEIVSTVTGDLVDVILTSSGPVARIGSCPSTYVHFSDGSNAPVEDGRVTVDCATGQEYWSSSNGLNASLTPPDPDGIVWLQVVEFDQTLAYLPVGAEHYPSVRIEDFDGGRVLLSRREGTMDRPPDHLLLVDLHAGTVEEIPMNRDVDRSAALLGPDDADFPDYWEPSWIGEPPHEPGVSDFFNRLPLSLRSEPQAQVEADEGTWMISRPTDGLSFLSNAWGCGVPGTDWCTYEYGEILLISGEGLVYALPTPGSPSSWIAVTDDYVYAGRIGDGALPDSTLIRIDRTTMYATTIVFEHDDGTEHLWPLGGPIIVHPDDPMQDRYQAVVSVGEPQPGMVAVESIGPIFVDLDGVESLITDIFNQRTVID